MSTLEPALDFARADAFMYAALGVLAARARGLADASEPTEASAPMRDDTILDALLGIVRLGDQLAAVVEGWSVDVDRDPGFQLDAAVSAPEELLR